MCTGNFEYDEYSKLYELGKFFYEIGMDYGFRP